MVTEPMATADDTGPPGRQPTPTAAATLFDASPYRTGLPRSLTERFVVPPFTVLDAAQGYWQERKRDWLSLGIRSEVGRDARAFNIGLNANPDNGWELADNAGSGTSVFDPVLCELVYRWWSPVGGRVLDPFAGGSVRGIVAAVTGRDYRGIELRPEQVAANIAQRAELGDYIPAGVWPPQWGVGDAAAVLAPPCPPIHADLVFTCPPYGNLERYSDDPRDLSAMSPVDFATEYRRIIGYAAGHLNPDRFAVFVVGNYRDERSTHMVDLVGLTVDAFTDAGMSYYADVVLVTSVGTAAVRASATFDTGRKPIRRHQYVLVFVKGDWHAAARAAEITGVIA